MFRRRGFPAQGLVVYLNLVLLYPCGRCVSGNFADSPFPLECDASAIQGTLEQVIENFEVFERIAEVSQCHVGGLQSSGAYSCGVPGDGAQGPGGDFTRDSGWWLPTLFVCPLCCPHRSEDLSPSSRGQNQAYEITTQSLLSQQASP